MMQMLLTVMIIVLKKLVKTTQRTMCVVFETSKSRSKNMKIFEKG